MHDDAGKSVSPDGLREWLSKTGTVCWVYTMIGGLVKDPNLAEESEACDSEGRYTLGVT